MEYLKLIPKMHATALADTLLHDEAMMADVVDWAETDGSTAQMPSRVLLEFLEEGYYNIPERNGSRNIPEILIPPSGALNKKGRDNRQEESLEEEALPTDFTAYPNPFDGSITFVTSGVVGQIVIYDIRGVMVDRLTVSQDEHNVVYGGQKLTRGIYIASYTSERDARQTIRIVKQ